MNDLHGRRDATDNDARLSTKRLKIDVVVFVAWLIDGADQQDDV